jgi:hypothetical protein
VIPGGNTFAHVVRSISYPKKPPIPGVNRTTFLPSGIFVHSTDGGKSCVAFCALRIFNGVNIEKQEELVCYRMISVMINAKHCIENFKNPKIPPQIKESKDPKMETETDSPIESSSKRLRSNGENSKVQYYLQTHNHSSCKFSN